MRRRLCALTAPVLSAVAVVAMSAPARADAPQEQGWWTVANPGGLPANPAALPSDVPADGLLVQGGPAGAPTAYAGVVYELAAATSADRLTLHVAAGSASTPSSTLELCPLVNPTVHTEQGGPMSDAPGYDCTHKVTAPPGGSTYTFPVSALAADGSFAVAILPVDPATRVVLNKPDVSSLTTAAALPPVAPPTGTPTPTPTGGAIGGSGGSAVAPPVALPSGADPVAVPAQPAATAPPAPAQQPLVAAPASDAPPLQAAPVAATSGTADGATAPTVALGIAGALLAASLWWWAGHRREDAVTDA